jgi:hypothetical protein
LFILRCLGGIYYSPEPRQCNRITERTGIVVNGKRLIVFYAACVIRERKCDLAGGDPQIGPAAGEVLFLGSRGKLLAGEA